MLNLAQGFSRRCFEVDLKKCLLTKGGFLKKYPIQSACSRFFVPTHVAFYNAGILKQELHTTTLNTSGGMAGQTLVPTINTPVIFSLPDQGILQGHTFFSRSLKQCKRRVLSSKEVTKKKSAGSKNTLG